MVWMVASGIVLAFWMAIGLCRMAAPRTEDEQRADDDAQIEWLRQYRLGNVGTAGPHAVWFRR